MSDSASAMATCRDEKPVFFEGDGAHLFGILSSPRRNGEGVAVVLAWGGALTPSCGRNAIRTRLARVLAGRGFHVLRFDARGVGESSGRPRPVVFSDPTSEDVVAAVRWLRTEGLSRTVLVGNCFGGRKVLAAAGDVPGLAGVALLGSPIRDTQHSEARAQRAIDAAADRPMSSHLRHMLNPATVVRLADGRWRQKAIAVIRAKLRRIKKRDNGRRPEVSDTFVDAVADVLTRGVPVLLLYGREDDFFPDLERALDGELGGVLERTAESVTVEILDERVVGFRTIRAQDQLVQAVSDWVARVAPAPVADSVSETHGALRG
jgi:pimeloyl-ACP methyl ester carboxylesterase